MMLNVTLNSFLSPLSFYIDIALKFDTNAYIILAPAWPSDIISRAWAFCG